MRIQTKNPLALILLFGVASVAVASSKISDEGYRLLRQLFVYKNHEIDRLTTLAQFRLDCNNVSDQDFALKKCYGRVTEMQSDDRDLQVKHDVLAQQIATHIREHKDDQWLFLGLLGDDREFTDLDH